MIYSKLLTNHSDYETYKNTSEPWAHHVSLCKTESHNNYDTDIFVKATYDVTSTSEQTRILGETGGVLSYQIINNKKTNLTVIDTLYTFNSLGDNIVFFNFKNETINNNAFYNCIRLKSINLPESITKIGLDAFLGCPNLEIDDVNLPNLTSIDFSSFQGTKVKKVSNLGSIPTMTTAFEACQQLESVVLPETVTTINDYAFYNCIRLTNFTYNGTMEQWSQITLNTNWKLNCPFSVVHCTDGDITL